jgi:hypothetical protein
MRMCEANLKMTEKSVVRFRQREASRTIRAVEQTGLTVERVELSPDGKISVYPGKRTAEQSHESEADAILAKLK